MPRLYFVAFLLLLGFMSCKQGTKQTILHPGNLSSQIFTIDTEKDTVITTAQGARLTIPKGSISGGGKVVQLQIREAYTIVDIIKAGLTSRAGDDPMSSGGMIYISAVDKRAKVVSRITVSMPTVLYRETMSVYTGKYNKDSSITWAEPVPLNKGTADDLLKCGKTLFQTNCNSCHDMRRDATGPRLLFMFYQHDEKWIEDFVGNPAKKVAEGDPYANCQYLRYKSLMTAFPTLTHSDFLCMRAYLDNEILKTYDMSDIELLKKSFDSCQFYFKLVYPLMRQDQVVRNYSSEAIDSFINALPVTANIDTGEYMPGEFATYRPDRNNRAANYQFTIDGFGWRNIDQPLSSIRGFEESTIKVTVTGADANEINVYLVIPGERIFLDGHPAMGNAREYTFDGEEGKITLPPGRISYILAFGEHDGKVVYAKSAFTIKPEQSFNLKMLPTTTEGFMKTIEQLNIDSVSISVRKIPGIDEAKKLRAGIKNIEDFKPKNCDCECK